jgi:hypothetical protein
MNTAFLVIIASFMKARLGAVRWGKVASRLKEKCR